MAKRIPVIWACPGKNLYRHVHLGSPGRAVRAIAARGAQRVEDVVPACAPQYLTPIPHAGRYLSLKLS